MNFQCKNCGSGMVYDPERKKMYCMHCESVDSHELKGDRSITVCPACGGEIQVSELTSSSRCSYCGNYLIFDERVEGVYKPDTILPFQISKKQAVEAMKEEFKGRVFTPTSFLSEPTLNQLNGYYVPFFLYDYEALGTYRAEGVKVRSWTSGGYDYTERSYYNIARNMRVHFDNIPQDASFGMEDDCMNLVEPYDYRLLTDFDPKFMSGFLGEIYNDSAEFFEPKARARAKDSASVLLRGSVSGYASINSVNEQVEVNPGKTDYALLPVWLYVYKWKDKIYRFFINGQTGKVVGETPVSIKKIWFYGGTLAAVVFLGLKFILKILEVM